MGGGGGDAGSAGGQAWAGSSHRREHSPGDRSGVGRSHPAQAGRPVVSSDLRLIDRDYSCALEKNISGELCDIGDGRLQDVDTDMRRPDCEHASPTAHNAVFIRLRGFNKSFPHAVTAGDQGGGHVASRLRDLPLPDRRWAGSSTPGLHVRDSHGARRTTLAKGLEAPGDCLRPNDGGECTREDPVRHDAVEREGRAAGPGSSGGSWGSTRRQWRSRQSSLLHARAS